MPQLPWLLWIALWWLLLFAVAWLHHNFGPRR
jgi:hypothetical protein